MSLSSSCALYSSQIDRFSVDNTTTSETSEDEGEQQRFCTAPDTPARQMTIVGKLTKPRASPRNLAKKDYAKIDDPFVGNGAQDGDGNQIFEKSSAESDDSAASDEEYGKAKDVGEVEGENAAENGVGV